MNKQDMMLGPRPTKACVSGAPPCRRCRNARTTCVFKPRANASAIHELLDETHELSVSRQSTSDHQAVLDRLERIEAALGIGDTPDEAPLSHKLSVDEDEDEDVPCEGSGKPLLI
ncbi:transcriptional regulator family: Fungal Specific TF [Penicillium atrosanguineum]|nr:transcriptional regulator family: Fungal Specific TF [Penicillium atrosanguineum]